MPIATDFKFDVCIAYIEYYAQAQNWVTGAKARSRGYILYLRIAMNNSETAIDINFKFSI